MRLTALLSVLALSLNASAMSIDWSGVYRFELVQVERPSLDADIASRKFYGLNYLGLSPKIIASDGIEISAKFDVLASQDAAYANSQFGQLWGLPHPAGAAPETTNVTSDTQEGTLLKVRELYLSVNQEYGSLLVGRAPFEFGLGVTWNAGNGPFDHWATTRDMMAYKFIVGNMYLMPMVSRTAVSGKPNAFGYIQDSALVVQYASEDSGSMIGAILNQRKASSAANDIDPAIVGGLGATQVEPYSMQTTSFILGRKWESFHFTMEASFVTGDYGVRTALRPGPVPPQRDPENVKANGYGVAIEMAFPRGEGSKWDYKLRVGAASGDDPDTVDNEGFQFNRNYDIAMLLFNHRLGQADFLRTGMIRSTAVGLDTSLDDEAISNAAYISPKISYAWSDRLDIDTTVTYAQAMTKPSENSVDFKKDLGIELDMGLVYKPRSNVRWVTELGLLAPGNAFKDGATDYKNGFTYGFATKAAITF